MLKTSSTADKKYSIIYVCEIGIDYFHCICNSRVGRAGGISTFNPKDEGSNPDHAQWIFVFENIMRKQVIILASGDGLATYAYVWNANSC